MPVWRTPFSKEPSSGEYVEAVNKVQKELDRGTQVDEEQLKKAWEEAANDDLSL